MRVSRVMNACRSLTLVALAGCLATTAVAASKKSAEYERRKVESVRKTFLKARTNGTAKKRNRFASSYLTDPALDEIVKGFPNLEFLSAYCHGNGTDAGVARVCKLEKIKTLYLNGNRITDAGLKSLSTVKGLENLRLRSSGIGDAGLQHLKSLKKLRSLRLSNTKVTAGGLQRLRAQLPNCKISSSSLPQASD